jgi:hypothetical protein
MLVKACIAATALFCAVAGLSRVDFRELYNEMYPVNGLRRDVLNLCHQAEPTFVRAVESNRVACYDGMPDPVERAIGWVRTSSRLPATRRLTPLEMAERALLTAAMERRVDQFGRPQFTGYATATGASLRPCEDVAKSLVVPAPAGLALAPPDERLARRAASGESAALAALGLPPRGGPAASQRPELPALSLGSTGDAGWRDGARGVAASLPDPTAAADLGNAASLLTPRAAAPGCKTPA